MLFGVNTVAYSGAISHFRFPSYEFQRVKHAAGKGRGTVDLGNPVGRAVSAANTKDGGHGPPYNFPDSLTHATSSLHPCALPQWETAMQHTAERSFVSGTLCAKERLHSQPCNFATKGRSAGAKSYSANSLGVTHRQSSCAVGLSSPSFQRTRYARSLTRT